jgi:hypothetical protein
MSRLTDRINAWRAGLSKRAQTGTQALEAASSKIGSSLSPVTIWLDGQCARTFGANGRTDTVVPLSTAGEVTAALKAIEALAPKPQRPGLHTLRVLVGMPFVRFYALPWQALPRPEDWVSSARAQAVRTGVGNESWRYAVSDGVWGGARLAAAVPDALCVGIERLCKTRKLQLLGIEPGYTFALQRHGKQIRDGEIAIVELEEIDNDEAVAHIGLRAGGNWTAFITLPVTGTLDEVLRDAIALCAPRPPERRYVIGPGDGSRWSADTAQIEWLRAPWDAAP